MAEPLIFMRIASFRTLHNFSQISDFFKVISFSERQKYVQPDVRQVQNAISMILCPKSMLKQGVRSTIQSVSIMCKMSDFSHFEGVISLERKAQFCSKFPRLQYFIVLQVDKVSSKSRRDMKRYESDKTQNLDHARTYAFLNIP